jgi:PAS domain S-box-containing protein
MFKPEEWAILVNAFPDAITVHDRDGRIIWANEQIERVYRDESNDLIGARCDQVFHRSGVDCPHSEVVEKKEGIWSEKRVSLRDRSYSIYISPLVEEGGEVWGYVRVMRDVTQEEMLQNQSLWAERFTTLGQMINGIAHDVGTPLNIISGYAEYLMMRTKPDGPGHKELSTILNQTRRIAEFIKQMLDLARPSQGRIDAIGLKGFLGETVDLMGHHLRKAQVRSTLTCKTEPPLIYGDAPRLRQAIFNLLLNACEKIGPEGSLEITLDDDTTDRAYARVIISGLDKSGEGIDFSKTFSTFLSTNQGIGATGMGLSLAKEVLNDFGARFETAPPGERGVGLIILLPKGKQAASRAI